MVRACVSSQSTSSSSDTRMSGQQLRAAVAHLDAQLDGPVQAGDGLMLDGQVQLQLLGHGLAHPHRESRCMLGVPSK